MEAILALDQGTSASKAAVYDLNGRMLGLGRQPVRTRYAAGGRADQDPEEILASQRTAIRRALRAAASHPFHLIAAGIASQRSTFVLWESATGRSVAPAPTWQSTMTRDVCARLSRHADLVARTTGLPLSPHYSATKIARLLDATRGLRRRAERGEILFGNVATFLVWHLTRGRVHATDTTHAARTLLFNLDTLQWDRRLLDLFDVPSAILPEVRDSLGDFGTMRSGGREVPLRAMLGDQQAAMLGAIGGPAPVASRTALVNYGTGAFVLIPTGRSVVRRPGLLTSLAWTGGGERCYLLEGTFNAAGAVLEWLRREMGAPASLAAIDRRCRSAPGRTVMLPAFWGIGSTHLASSDPRVPSLVLDVAEHDTVSDLARASVEAIAHMTFDLLDRASGASGRGFRRVVAAGGLAGLDYLVEFQSALLGRPVFVSESVEATLGGVARAATRTSKSLARTGRQRRVTATSSLRRVAQTRHRDWQRLIRVAERWAGKTRA